MLLLLPQSTAALFKPPPFRQTSARRHPALSELAEIIVQALELRYVAFHQPRPHRSRVPVFINEKGPFRLVLISAPRVRR
ncbi:MAG: hypothetical protein IPM70_10595 [Proteobacteria bacterium]|nr:hypothetical protein [Pseudomonadota bacterium]